MNKYEKVKLTKIRQSSNNCLHKCYESNKSAYESINAFVYQSLCESNDELTLNEWMNEMNQKRRKFSKIYLELKSEIEMCFCIYLKSSWIK